jgi:serine/threonine protein kinase
MGGCVSTHGDSPQEPSEFHKLNLVLNRYSMDRKSILGEGTSSICYKGTDVVTGEEVAIKVYKQPNTKGGKSPSSRITRTTSRPNAKTLTKFRRQVKVLQELQEPLLPPADPKLWSQELEMVEPGDLFVRLLWYSQDEKGEPGPDPCDGNLYVVTELAQYDLKQYLKEQKQKGHHLSKEKVHSIAKAITLSVAGLHAKGFTHLDLKPANLMMFGGRWKLIDVDGCVKVGTGLNVSDDTISFSPCYCAPEWARFVVQDTKHQMIATPSLDAWSVGMTLCELVTLDPPMKHKYQAFVEADPNSRNACFNFLEWLGGVKNLPLPGSVGRFDQGFYEFVMSLLVSDRSMRKTLAQCLASPYLTTVPVTDREFQGRTKSLKNVAVPCAGSGPTLLGTRTIEVN